MIRRYFLPFFFQLLFVACYSPVNAQEPLYPTLEQGIQAPDVKGKNEKGKSCSLSKIKTRLILLYFYELHCHLCESMIPQLKVLYDAYHKTGLEIVAVPVNADRNEWKKYISDLQLPWKHLQAGKGENAMKSDYRLTVSPTFYLLDKKHVLLTRRLGRIEQVEEALNIHAR